MNGSVMRLSRVTVNLHPALLAAVKPPTHRHRSFNKNTFDCIQLYLSSSSSSSQRVSETPLSQLLFITALKSRCSEGG